MLDELRRIALFGSGVAELTRHQAEQIVKDLVKAGDVKRKQASSVVKDLVDGSKENRAALITMIRSEIKNQLGGGGVSARDVERLERRIARLEKNLAEAGVGKPARSPASKRTVSSAPAPKRTVAKKTGAKKTAASSKSKSTSAKRTSSKSGGQSAATAKKTVAEAPPASDTGLADHEGS